jgi:phosphatidylglycerophosphate synthase
VISTASHAAPGRTAPLKTHDTIVAVLFASRVAERLLRPAIRAGLSPNRVTWASLALSAAAALAIASTAPSLRIPGALLVLASFVADCLDGLLARETGRESDFGAYLDAMTDLVKVALLLGALAFAAGGGAATLAGVAFLFFVLCQHHAHVVRRFPQRAQADYESVVTPWKSRLAVSGQRIDVAFAVGEVLATIALGAALGRPLETLALLAIVLPIQFGSYAIRFWRHRYRPSSGAVD